MKLKLRLFWIRTRFIWLCMVFVIAVIARMQFGIVSAMRPSAIGRAVAEAYQEIRTVPTHGSTLKTLLLVLSSRRIDLVSEAYLDMLRWIKTRKNAQGAYFDHNGKLSFESPRGQRLALRLMNLALKELKRHYLELLVEQRAGHSDD